MKIIEKCGDVLGRVWVNLSPAFINKYNAIVGTFVAVMTALLGVYWYVFGAFLLLNLLDWLTGWYKAHRLQIESSEKGLKGILKKLGYWIIITVAFLIAEVMTRVGADLLDLNLKYLSLIGWLTIATLIVNEARSIVENLAECGHNVPEFLIRGLAITDLLIKKKAESEELNE